MTLNGAQNGMPPIALTSWPAYFASDGFGSHVSTCDGPPWEKMWMTRFALAGN